MNPLVSVIIPTYNVEHYIGQAIQSVLDQSNQDFEIVIVDDCSTDDTINRVKAFNDPRIRLEVNEENYGPSYTRNRAFDLAEGQWAAVLDSDDWWDRERLDKLLKSAQAYGADVVCDDFCYVINDKPRLESSHFKERNIPIKEPKFINPVDIIDYDLGPVKPIFNKKFLQQHNLSYREEIKYGEDFTLLLESVLFEGRMLALPDVLYFRRIRQDSLMSQKVISNKRLVELTATLIKDLGSNNYPKKYPEVMLALQRRLENQSNSLVYNEVFEPFKEGKTVAGMLNLAYKFVEDPRLRKMLIKRIPQILNNRIGR